MATILYCWELGNNLGHVSPFVHLAEHLRARGHHVYLTAPRPSTLSELLHRTRFTCFQAPVVDERQYSAPTVSYPDILRRITCQSPEALYGAVQAWRALIELTDARLVMADHAPAALIAARSLNVPVMLFSYGFTCPPDLYPCPSIRPWLEIDAETLKQIDDEVCAVINSVLKLFGGNPIDSTAKLFDVAEAGLLTYPELDHYGADRPRAAYWGGLPDPKTGAGFEWPKGQGPRCFVYLRRSIPHLNSLLEALVQCGTRTVVFFPDVSDALAKQMADAGIKVYRSPLNLEQATQEADVAVGYAGLQTTTAFLLAGIPMLLLPSHLEQFMLARRVQDMGAGIVVHPEEAHPAIGEKIQSLLNHPGYRDSARAFANKYQSFQQSTVLSHLVRRIETLIG